MTAYELDHVEQEVLDQIVLELRARGRRAVDFLVTARGLAADGSGLPCLPEAVAYCLREALESIADLPDDGESAKRRQAISGVLAAKRTYLRAVESQTAVSDATTDLQKLLEAIAELDRPRGAESRRQLGLLAVITERTGAEPYPVRAEIGRELRNLVEDLNSALHDRVKEGADVGLYNRASSLLRRLFMPPLRRFEELEALARAADPGPAQLVRLRSLVVSPQHLQAFAKTLRTAAWLDVLAGDALLDPPREHAGWAGFAVVSALGASDPAGVVRWLGRVYERCSREPIQSWYVFHAAKDLGDAAYDLLVRVLTDHISSSALRGLAWANLQNLNPTDVVVERVADQLLNDHGDPEWHTEDVGRALVAGFTRDNATSRLTLLAMKLRATAQADSHWGWFHFDEGRSIADEGAREPIDRLHALIAAFVSGTALARAILGTEAVLAIVDRIPEPLRGRMRAWLLGTDPRAEASALAAEVAGAVATRRPTADDLPMLDRVVADLEPSDYLPLWANALGEPPDDEAVDAVLNDGRWNPQIARAYEWLGVLPEGVADRWQATYGRLRAEYGVHDRERLTKHRAVEAGWMGSPYSVDELQAPAVLDAARMVATWRADPSEWGSGTRELARQLQQAVGADPARWLDEPSEVAVALREPLYISHYLAGAVDAIKEHRDVQVEGLLDLVDLVILEPWDAEPMGSRDWDYEPTWRPARAATVEVLRALASTDVGFAGRDEHAWMIVEAAALDRIGRLADSKSDDPLAAAINTENTRALDASFALMAYDVRRGCPLRPGAFTLLDDAVRATGADGARRRAIIATRLPFLAAHATEWLQSHEAETFGAGAGALGQLTVDLALMWNSQARWVLEHRRPDVLDAVRRGVEHALGHVLLAYLWQIHGYDRQAIRGFLVANPELVSAAGEQLGRLLRDADPEMTAAGAALWREVLETAPSTDLSGFGWFSEAKALDDAEWCELTVETALKSRTGLDWAHGIGERLSRMEPSVTSLRLLDELVRHPHGRWDAYRIEEVAVAHIAKATSLTESAEYRRLHAALAERGML